MLVSRMGSAPQRAAYYVNLKSLSERPGEGQWQRILDAAPGPEREKVLAQPMTSLTMEVEEILEDPAGPERRQHRLVLELERRTCGLYQTTEWNRDGRYRELGGTPSRTPVGWMQRAYELGSKQRPWKEALLALMQRTQREKTVTEQSELAPFGYEYVQSDEASTLPELTARYLWGLSGPTRSSIKASLPDSTKREGTARLQGKAEYFQDTTRADRGYTVAPPNTPVYLYPLEPSVAGFILNMPRVTAVGFSDLVPESVRALRQETRVNGEAGEFRFERLQPGLYLLECRIPYRHLADRKVVHSVEEERRVYRDGSYDVVGVKENARYEPFWTSAPGNWTYDVVEVQGGEAPTRFRLCNLREEPAKSERPPASGE